MNKDLIKCKLNSTIYMIECEYGITDIKIDRIVAKVNSGELKLSKLDKKRAIEGFELVKSLKEVSGLIHQLEDEVEYARLHANRLAKILDSKKILY